MIYRFRAILNSQDEVYRDLEIQENATFEDFHNALTQAFGFEGQEVASFYAQSANFPFCTIEPNIGVGLWK